MIVRDFFDGRPAQHVRLVDLSDRELRRLVSMGSREAARVWAQRKVGDK